MLTDFEFPPYDEWLYNYLSGDMHLDLDEWIDDYVDGEYCLVSYQVDQLRWIIIEGFRPFAEKVINPVHKIILFFEEWRQGVSDDAP